MKAEVEMEKVVEDVDEMKRKGLETRRASLSFFLGPKGGAGVRRG